MNAAVVDSYDNLYAHDFSDAAIYVIEDLSLRVDGTYLHDREIKGPGFQGSDRMFLYEWDD